MTYNDLQKLELVNCTYSHVYTPSQNILGVSAGEPSVNWFKAFLKQVYVIYIYIHIYVYIRCATFPYPSQPYLCQNL